MVNTKSFFCEWNFKISKNDQKVRFFQDEKLSNSFKSKSGRIFNGWCLLRCFSERWRIVLKCQLIFSKNSAIFYEWFFALKFLKGGVFFRDWNELFWQKRFESSVIVVWPRELVRLIGNCLENIFIIYHMVIRRLEKFLRVCEV